MGRPGRGRRGSARCDAQRPGGLLHAGGCGDEAIEVHAILPVARFRRVQSLERQRALGENAFLFAAAPIRVGVLCAPLMQAVCNVLPTPGKMMPGSVYT